MGQVTAIHAQGNGSFLIYGRGADISSIHPGIYSTPSVASFYCEEEDDAQTCRLPGTNTWLHTFRTAQGDLVYSDSLDPEYNVFRRTVRSGYESRIRVEIHSSAQWFDWEDYAIGNQTRRCVCIRLPRGTLYFTGEALRQTCCLFILCDGCVRMDSENRCLCISPGEGEITLVASQPQKTERHLSAAAGNLDVTARSTEAARAYLARIATRFPDHPVLDSAIESVALLIKAQQAKDGGVMAGHIYPMAYVRDQAGVARGLLRMGLVDEARAIVEFWKQKFDHFGDLLNAETMGHHDARHPYANDEVELPAYIMLTAFACAEKAGGAEYLASLKPMLSWAAHTQAKHVVHGMTGFNGDETYIAGNLFPRYFLYHGSAESTMLFILSTEKYLAAFGPDTELEALLHQARGLYRDNFLVDGQLMANNPLREQYRKPPRFHVAYCDLCWLEGRPAPLDWLERSPEGRYRCPACRNRKAPPLPKSQPYPLGSIALLPAWHGFDMITDDEIASTVQPFLDTFRQTGQMTPAPGTDMVPGYDYALLLTTLIHLRHPDTAAILQAMLRCLDETGAWVEYYKNGQPFNCRCRPWESAINIAAAIDAAEMLQQMP